MAAGQTVSMLANAGCPAHAGCTVNMSTAWYCYMLERCCLQVVLALHLTGGSRSCFGANLLSRQQPT